MTTSLAIFRAATSYPLFTLIATLLLATTAAVLGKRTLRARLIHSTYVAGTSLLAVFAGSWLMYLIHG